jgi:hypothetical protein
MLDVLTLDKSLLVGTDVHPPESSAPPHSFDDVLVISSALADDRNLTVDDSDFSIKSSHDASSSGGSSQSHAFDDMEDLVE